MRITYDIHGANGETSTATLAQAGMRRRGFTDMESYAVDFERRYALNGIKVTRRAVPLDPTQIHPEIFA